MSFLKYILTILVVFFLGVTGFSANHIDFGEGKEVLQTDAVKKILNGIAKQLQSKLPSTSQKYFTTINTEQVQNGINFLKNGCFTKDTPVLMAGNTVGRSGKMYVAAAMMPLVALPIDDAPLLGWAVAHEKVNSTYGLTASVDDDVYLGLLDKDPYTSDQQRERDEYKLDDENWNEVVFEEVYGGSIAKLALHNDWIEKQSYKENAILNLSLPEMGISGLFEITSIKHILPQKKPVDEDETDDYSYKPVTGLFIHEASDVWRIKFDNGEELGVTHKHPIYSTTKGDWELAGELEIGEEVLTKSGNTKVVSSTKKEGSETVYNLEVKELHNYLVGESGVVVHNSYIDELYKIYNSIIGNKGLRHIFHGEINSVGRAVGVHHIRAIKDGVAKIIPNTKISVGPPNSGIYKAKVQVKDGNDWITKKNAQGDDVYSTFYPDDWNEVKVMDKITEANNNVKTVITNTSNKYEFIGETSEGLEILIVRYPQYENKIGTAFLNYD